MTRLIDGKNEWQVSATTIAHTHIHLSRHDRCVIHFLPLALDPRLDAYYYARQHGIIHVFSYIVVIVRHVSNLN